jgi:two-component system response regulator PilR (NtrC family)
MARILIVDDEDDVVFVIRRLLKENGYDICEAPNGWVALRLFQAQFFDLIITDLRMPMLDGISFLHEVKKLDPATPVIILTAFATPESAAAAVEGGASLYLAKPFKAKELLDVVKRMLGGAGQGKPCQPVFAATR